uniref:Uncharacterized protein n=1 Tax=Tanacetum cinerariifolium TaxID=118510 RepID=A0A6L2LBC7_TANCI|nr:hypothetical protein [Tanacetum cinerariifolium]
MQTQRKAQQANEFSNLTRQRQLLASVYYRHAIIEDFERLPEILVAYKTREDLKRIQKVVLIKVIELKKELRLQQTQLEGLLLANSYLLKDQLHFYFDLKTRREVELATEINNLTSRLLDIMDERRSFIVELEQRLPTNVMAYKTRQELKGLQRDGMIRAMEMRSTAL